tara:strand:+ start:369 stop:881 length:513 start_codon:yes stop_codon:yes gene_type:complete
MKNFDLQKYLAEGKLLKESTLEHLIDKYGQKMIDFTVKVDQLTDDEVNDVEYLEDRIKTHLEEPAIRQKYLAEGKLLNESAPGYDTRKFGESLPTMESIKAAYEAKNNIEEDLEPNKLEDMGYSAGEKALMDINLEIFNQPNFNSYVSGFIKGFQDNVRASQDYADSIDA